MRTEHEQAMKEFNAALRGLRYAIVFVTITTIASAIVLIVRAAR